MSESILIERKYLIKLVDLIEGLEQDREQREIGRRTLADISYLAGFIDPVRELIGKRDGKKG